MTDLQRYAIFRLFLEYPMDGYVSTNQEWAAIPYGREYMILHRGFQVHHVKTLREAIDYIKIVIKKNSSVKAASTRSRRSKATLSDLFV